MPVQSRAGIVRHAVARVASNPVATGADPRFAVIGEALIDLVDPGDDAACRAHPGGSPYNVAVGLARLGQPTAFVGRFSHDPFGTVLRKHAARSGVDLDFTVTDRAPSTIALLELQDGAARYEFSVDATVDFQWSAAELDHLPTSAEIVHYGSLASWLPPGADVIERRIAEVHAAGKALVSYDPNVRPQLQHDAATARKQVERALGTAHVVKASAEDLHWLYDGEPSEPVARRWLAAGPTLVIVTRGGDGSTAFVEGAAPVARPVHPAPVVDTVGAGDAFTSGLLDALGRRGITAPAQLDRLRQPGALAPILDEAALVAALACTRAGADPPRLDDVEPLRAALGSDDGTDVRR
jgi:fructokinase